MDTVTYYLPLPPSLNRIWRAVGGRVLLSAAARAFVPKVINALPKGRITTFRGRLHVEVLVCPPVKLAGRAWDIMNREKLLCDSLTKARVWLDDSQIDFFSVERGQPISEAFGNWPDGCARVTIRPLDDE